jgi:hypothetical protein
MSLSTNEWLTIVGTLASIVGVVVTVVTLRGVRKINSTLLRRKRLPELLKSLKGRMTDLNNDLLNRESSIESASTLDLLGRIRSDLASAHQKSNSPEIKKVIKTVKNLEKKKNNASQSLEDLYGQLGGVVALIENLVEDDKWEIN